MKKNPVYISAICFLLLALLPSYMVGFFSHASRTFGLLLASIIVFSALIPYVKFIQIPFSWNNNLIIIFIWILFVTPIIGGVNYSSKSFLSLLIAVFLLLFAFLIEVWFEKCDISKLYRLVQIVCGVFILIGWSGYFLNFKMFGYNGITLFSEPAHFARIAGPIYVVAFFLVPKKFKLIILANAAIQSVLLQSLALLVYTVVILTIVLQMRGFRFVVPVVFIIAILTVFLIKNPVYSEHFTSRLTISPKSGNLTSLVWLQGVVAAKNSLLSTGGLGLGFQMLGTEKPNEISKIINDILSRGGELCRPGGGCVAAKLIAELGLVGVILAGFAFAKILKSFIWLRRYWRVALRFKVNWSNYQLKMVIANSLIVTFFVEMFLRGGGYFSLTGILFILSLLYVRKYRRVSETMGRSRNHSETGGYE